MRESLGALHRAAFLCAVFALAIATLAIAAPAIAEDSDDAKEPGTLRARGFEAFDTDGDGKLSETEKTAARKKQHDSHLEQFDTDGDGKLSGEEKEQAKAAREKRRERQGRGPGDRPALDQPGNAPHEP